ncbi:MAG: hypothetical protein AB7Y46_15635 [Armatimonadota bacterium]
MAGPYPHEAVAYVLAVCTTVAALLAAAGLVAATAPRWRGTRAAGLSRAAWAALGCGTLGAALVHLPQGPWLSASVRAPSWVCRVVELAVVGVVGLLLLAALAVLGVWATSARHWPALRRTGTLAALAALVPTAVAVGPASVDRGQVVLWRTLAPRTPFGVVRRIEFRVDDQRSGDEVIGGDTLATWTDAQIVAELSALAPWTSRGLGHATRCTEGSPLHVICVTDSGREPDVILPCDGCPMAEPAWREGRAGWEVPELLTRVGELLAPEPAARAYAAQFDEEERGYRALWLYWTADPWDVRARTED